MINEEKYIEFIIENKLTQSQFLLLHLVYKNRWDLIKKYKEAFPTGDGTIIGKQATDLLLERGYLINDNGTAVVSNKFKEFYTTFNVVDEIFSIYPQFTTNEQGVNIPLTAVDRTMFEKIYLDKIMYSAKEHFDIIKDINYGKENNLIKIGLSKFLNSEYWKVLRQQRIKDENEKVMNNKLLNNLEDEDFS